MEVHRLEGPIISVQWWKTCCHGTCIFTGNSPSVGVTQDDWMQTSVKLQQASDMELIGVLMVCWMVCDVCDLGCMWWVSHVFASQVMVSVFLDTFSSC